MIQVESVIQRWYVELSYNNRNSPAYVDMIRDMEILKEGVFAATFKINDGTICDYVVMENEAYVDTTTPKTY